MPFIDEIKIHIQAGRGGDGVVRWRTEKFKPKAGPGGGNGGRGGNVYAEAISDLAYLETYQHIKNFKAGNGDAGSNFGKEGKNGEHLVIKFPIGSLIKNLSNDRTVELSELGQKELLLRGGKGGFGNEYFKSSTNTTPKECTKGVDGEDADFSVELQLIADIGLVGLPNAGKSTLLNALTSAKSKVAAYQFTTLDPYLGVLKDGRVLADIPGLIEGASEGKGLGHKFLRHIRRTKEIWHLISLENENIGEVYETIRNELKKYDPTLTEKKELIVLTKKDAVTEEELKKKIKEIKKIAGKKPVIAVSAYDDTSLSLQKFV